MELLLLGADDLSAALPMEQAIAAMRRAFAAYSGGQAVVPQRLALPVAERDGVTLLKSGYVPAGDGAAAGLACKLVSIFPHNPRRGTPTTTGLVVILDPDTGEPRALADGAALTALRTGAASGLATEMLARPDARRAVLFGCGAQARTQALAIDSVRDLQRIVVCGRDSGHVAAFVESMQGQLSARLEPAADVAAAVRSADIVCTATSSATPVFDGAWLSAGCHINGIGSFTADLRELDEQAVGRCRVFVDAHEAACREAGDLLHAERAGRTNRGDWTELGALLTGTANGRLSPEELTLFKSVGLAVQDVIAASVAFERAIETGRGRRIEW